MLRSPGFVARSARLLAELAPLARPRVELNARVGFEDPSDTGALLGWMYSGSVLGTWFQMRVEPDFRGEVLQGKISLVWKRNMASLAWPVLKFMLSPVVWRAVFRVRAHD